MRCPYCHRPARMFEPDHPLTWLIPRCRACRRYVPVWALLGLARARGEGEHSERRGALPEEHTPHLEERAPRPKSRRTRHSAKHSSHSGLKAAWYRLLRHQVCARVGHKGRVSKEGTSYCARCRVRLT